MCPRGPSFFFALTDCTVERVQLKHDKGDIHLMGQNDAIFQGDGFSSVKGVMCKEGLAQGCCDVPTGIPNNYPNTRG